MMIEVAIVVGVLGVGIGLVAWGTVTKNRWGINLEPNNCPRCKAVVPPVRTPQSTRQMLWGGSTCSECDAEMNKWGQELTGK